MAKKEYTPIKKDDLYKNTHSSQMIPVEKVKTNKK